MEALGHNVDLVVVGFPYRLGLWRTGKDGATPVDQGDVRRAKFGFRGLTSVASVVARHELMTGTDAENGDVQLRWIKSFAKKSIISGSTLDLIRFYNNK